jgi:hypothetical protein
MRGNPGLHKTSLLLRKMTITATGYNGLVQTHLNHLEGIANSNGATY